MTDEVQPAEVPESGLAAPETIEAVDTGTTPDVAEEAEQPEAPEKPKGGFQRRIAELVEQRNEARRALDSERRRIDELVTYVSRQQQPPEPAKPPTLEGSGYDEQKYQAAVIEYAKAEARREAIEAIKADRIEAEREARQQTFKAKESDFASRTEDYLDAVYDPSVPISPAMAEVISESDVGPQLAYHLAKHRDVARAIYGLSPVAAARELGRLEAKLSAPPPPAPTKAPPPPPTVEATEPEIERDPDKMPIEEWLKWRRKQIRQSR